MEKYIIGQTWISESEPELGICRVLELPLKRVTVFFPSATATRTYSFENAPLKRVKFDIGDSLVTLDGSSFVVQSVRDESGLLFYSDGVHEFSETELDAVVDFSEALVRLKNLDIDSLEKFNLRYETLQHQFKTKQSRIRGLSGARIELIPHQLYVAHKAYTQLDCRIMLADEVGLGKTIEACLIMNRLLITSQISRVLILLPDPLIHQWFVELFRRFNLVFQIFDKERCGDLENESSEGHPFNNASLLLCGLGFLSDNPKYARELLDSNWDLLIVDEAHHLEWDHQTGGCFSYNLVTELSKRIEKIILLSGTPEQLGIEGHFARLMLLDPDRYFDLNDFLEEQSHYNEIAKTADNLLNNKTLTDEDHSVIDALAARSEMDLSDLESVSREMREELLGALLDQYGTGRAIYRNTRHVTKGFPKRVAKLYEIPCPEDRTEFLDYLRHEFDVEKNHKALDFNYNYSDDPRISHLIKILRKFREDKFLLICHSKRKAEAIKTAIQAKENINVGLFHEDMTIINRDRDAAWFAQKDGAQVLICSEIGSEGRNFQFAHHLVLYDLPLNPSLMEQRIGRLDRIGQRETMTIHIPYLVNSPQEVMARWYHDGLNTIEQHLPGGHEFLKPFTNKILNLAIHPHKEAEINELIKETREFRDKLVDKLEHGRDHLLELNSYKPDDAALLVDEVKKLDHDHSLEEYCMEAFDLFGIQVEKMSLRSYLLSAVNCTQALPSLGHEDITVTCSRAKALEREDIHFLSWEHPLIIGLMDAIVTSEFGNCSFAVWKSDTLQIILEAIYILECRAPSELHADRYLSPTPIRIVLDNSMKDISDLVDVKKLNAILKPGKKHMLEDFPQIISKFLPEMLEECHSIADKRGKSELEKTLKLIEKNHSSEIKRLIALREHNPNISDDEIAKLVEHTEELSSYVSKSVTRLDSLRLILKGP